MSHWLTYEVICHIRFKLRGRIKFLEFSVLEQVHGSRYCCAHNRAVMDNSSLESVFYRAALGTAEGSLLRPGVDKVHMLFTEADKIVSVEDIRNVYKEQGWEENTSLDLAQFTVLWTALIIDEKDVLRQDRQDLDLTWGTDGENAAESRMQSVCCNIAGSDTKESMSLKKETLDDSGVATTAKHMASTVADDSDDRSGDGAKNPAVDSHKTQEQAMEQQVRRRLVDMWEETLAQAPEALKASLPTTAFETFAKENLANARSYVASASKGKPMDVAIRRELENKWAVMMEKVPASVQSILGTSAFEDFVTQEWETVAQRLEMQVKKDAEASAFVPRIDVEFGTSDISVVEVRRQLLLNMDTERNEILEAKLQEQWTHSVRCLPAEVAVLVPTMPSQQFYEDHYYEYMMKLFGKESARISSSQPSSLESRNTNSVIGMRGILQKRPLLKGKEITYGSMKQCDCHDLLHDE